MNKFYQFFEHKDENGITNAEKIASHQKVIRRISTTDKNKSYEESSAKGNGVVLEDGKLIGFGIHIFNEDIYPLQSFEIYLRNCDLSGDLDLSGQKDLLFVDVYHNRISEISVESDSSLRILGIQDNQITKLDMKDLVSCQGIDAGKNRLSELDVSNNQELVELYVNDNQLEKIDLSHCPKLKYFYCHNNRMSELDTRDNPLLRHLIASGNPMKKILSLAPGREESLPLELTAGEGGCIGLQFNPVYNAQWKETGEWQQKYYAYPEEGYAFEGWYDPEGKLLSDEREWTDKYGSSRILHAVFRLKQREDEATIQYYEDHAETFTANTINADIGDLRSRFQAHMPEGARILDFGCGSGRDTKAFLEEGYCVDAADGSEELCRSASEFTGVPVRHMLFQELSVKNQYDGIWACASILHLPKKELLEVFHRITAALKPGGVLYTSFKYGTFEGMRNGRYFSDFTEETFSEFIKQIPDLDVFEQWTTQDVRPGRGEEQWLNILARRS